MASAALSEVDSITDWEAWSQGSAALRNFGSSNVRVGSFTSRWLLRSTARMSASHPKGTESLRSSEMTLSANNGRRDGRKRYTPHVEQYPQAGNDAHSQRTAAPADHRSR